VIKSVDIIGEIIKIIKEKGGSDVIVEEEAGDK